MKTKKEALYWANALLTSAEKNAHVAPDTAQAQALTARAWIEYAKVVEE